MNLVRKVHRHHIFALLASPCTEVHRAPRCTTTCVHLHLGASRWLAHRAAPCTGCIACAKHPHRDASTSDCTRVHGAAPVVTREERRRKREAAQAAQAQSEKRARAAEEVHWARVRAAMAAVALRKGGRRWRPSAARAVVRAVRAAEGSGTVANGSRSIHAIVGPKMVTNCRGGGRTSGSGGRGTTYERSYPVCTEEPVRREGATGPERPKRMRPDGAVCYVEGKNGGLGVKRRNVQQGEQTGRPPGRPPEGR